MARIIKDYDERLNELLDAAQTLFFSKGYEKTSVNDIINSVGVAKGTFYHYFNSKVDLLDKLVDRFISLTFQEAQEMSNRPFPDAIEKLNAFFETIRNQKVAQKDLMMLFMKVMYTDENLMLRHKMFRRSVEKFVPLLREIIEEGVTDGSLQPVDVVETPELIYGLGISINETVVQLLLQVKEKPDNLTLIESKISALERCIERLLGAKERSVIFVNRQILEAFKPEEG